MRIEKSPQMTREQQRRHELQIDWLISALARAAEKRPARIDEASLRIGRRCPTCGAALTA